MVVTSDQHRITLILESDPRGGMEVFHTGNERRDVQHVSGTSLLCIPAYRRVPRIEDVGNMMGCHTDCVPIFARDFSPP